MVRGESPWGWMFVGFLVGTAGLLALVVSTSTPVTAAACVAVAVGGVVTFVSGIAAGVSNGLARHEALHRTR